VWIFPRFFSDDIYGWITTVLPGFPLSHQQLLLLIKLVEIVAMVAILAFTWFAEGVQKRWTDYRFLAERIRTALVLTVAGTNPGPLRYEELLYKPRQPHYWIAKAYLGLWYQTPPATQTIDLGAQKKFLRTAWIEEQIAFYSERGDRQERGYELLDASTLLLFVLTLLAALISFAGIMIDNSLLDERVLLAIGILFPLAGASLAGLIAIRGYPPNAERYHQMKEPLNIIERRIDNALDRERLIGVIDDGYNPILRENNEWRFNLLSLKLR
jgi:hypothetical protein